LGVLLTGILAPHLLTDGGKEGWRVCWLLLALITFAVAVIASFLLKEWGYALDSRIPNMLGLVKWARPPRISRPVTGLIATACWTRR